MQYIFGFLSDLPNDPGDEYNASGQIILEDQHADPGMMIYIPVQLENNSIEEIIDEILNDDIDFDQSKNLSYSDFFAKKLSKSSSIKSGKKLNLDEQEFLVNQLFSCKEPNLSPDNKQIFITLNKNDIENRF